METWETITVSAEYSTVQCSTVQYSTVQYSTVQYSTVQYSTVQYNTIQYSTVLHAQYVQYVPNIPVVKTSFPLGARLVPEFKFAGTRASSGICV